MRNTEQKEVERGSSVLSELTASSIDTLETWFDDDFDILRECTSTLSETICFLNIYNEASPGLVPDIERNMVVLSHLYTYLKTFEK